MTTYSIIWAPKIVLINSYLYYIITLSTITALIRLIKNNYNSFNNFYILLLLPGIPPSPIFITKLWAINFFIKINFLHTVLLMFVANIFLMYLYLNFLEYSTFYLYIKKKVNYIGTAKYLIAPTCMFTFLFINPTNILIY